MLEKPGEFAIGSGAIAIMPRGPGAQGPGRPRRLSAAAARPTSSRAARRGAAAARRRRSRPAARAGHARPSERLTLDAPVLTALIGGEREKRRPVALSAIPDADDRRRCSRSRIAASTSIPASIRSASSARSSRTSAASAPTPPARSTITQQVVRNVFLPKMFAGMTLKDAREQVAAAQAARECGSRSCSRRARRRTTILEMYLNDMPLGQRGSFAIVGVAEASRLFFGKDVSNVSLAEAATIAGVIQSPSALSPFNNPARCKERRNVVLQAMVDAGLHRRRRSPTAPSREPLAVVAARARSRGAALRRLRRPDARRAVSGPDDHDQRRRSTSTRRSICTCSGWRRTPCATA